MFNPLPKGKKSKVLSPIITDLMFLYECEGGSRKQTKEIGKLRGIQRSAGTIRQLYDAQRHRDKRLFEVSEILKRFHKPHSFAEGESWFGELKVIYENKEELL
jgi:hypothetical protein